MCCYTLHHRLDQNMTVKVADFGLSRDVYVTDYYTMRHSVPLPVKWLAPEALFDGHFSQKTDVVSGYVFNSVDHVHVYYLFGLLELKFSHKDNLHVIATYVCLLSI